MAPQIVLLALYFISLLIAANDHGKPKKGNHNFWIQAISVTLSLLLLNWGGFFDGIF